MKKPELLFPGIVAATTMAATILTAGVTYAKPAEKTFNLIVEAHCTSAATVCDYGSEDNFRAWAQQGVYDLSNYWRPVGFSFRLKDVTFAYGDNYSTVATGGGEPGEEADLALINDLRTKANQNPSDLYLFVLDSLPFCFSGVPGAHLGRVPPLNSPNEYYGVFCNGVDGNTIAHEFGHHFCLAHPFSFEDPTASGAAPNHDGDGIADTPDDPGEIEAVDTNAATDKQNGADAIFDVGEGCRSDPESCANKINDYRDWCGFNQFPSDAGSFMGHFCTPDCRRKGPDGVTSIAFSPLTNLTMSYYFRECGGPFVYNFTTYEGFTPGEVSEIRDCHLIGQEREQLVNFCAGDTDTDWDGLCDKQDPCPKHRASIWDADTDGDGIPDACDSCPTIDNEGIDTDGDGVDNACDPNDDNDACNDIVDEHPLDATIQVGQVLMPGCGSTTHPIMASESVDTDDDGIPDCRDDDNDDDGTKDVDDPCPNTPGIDLCTVPGEGCAMEMPWADCMGGGCGLDIMARLESLMNPDDPRLDFPVDFRGDDIFLLPAIGHTAGELRGAMTGKAFGMLEGGEKIKMTLISRANGDLVADVGTFRIADVAVAAQSMGTSLAVKFDGISTPIAAAPEPRAAETLIKLQVGLTWGVGVPTGDTLPDADLDGVPDSVDNCVNTANVAQADIDKDRFGDACDPDFDNDGKVSEAEADVVRSCVGVMMRPTVQFKEPEQYIPAGENAAAAHAESMRCKQADLDGNGQVTAQDQEMAEALAGMAPGPSGLVPAPVPVEPLPDQSSELIQDAVTSDTTAATDTNGGDEGGSNGSGGCSNGKTGNTPPVMLLVAILCAIFLVVRRTSIHRR